MAKLRPDIHCSDPGRILGAMDAVVLDHAATSNWFSLGQGDDAIGNSIQFLVRAELAENNVRRVASLAPPLVVHPEPDGFKVLGAL